MFIETLPPSDGIWVGCGLFFFFFHVQMLLLHVLVSRATAGQPGPEGHEEVKGRWAVVALLYVLV